MGLNRIGATPANRLTTPERIRNDEKAKAECRQT
jgi:hypothetical protein